MFPTAYLALGSNLGDRLANLRAAISGLRDLGAIRACSSVYETEPREYTDQPWFLNMVLAMESSLAPRALTRSLLAIEAALGRERHADSPPQGPRLIDLDLLLYGDHVLHDADLQVPHPRFHERLFVLAPFAEIAAAELTHPTLKRSIRDLYDALADDANAGKVRIYAPSLC